MEWCIKEINTKGQIISKGNCVVLNFPKNPNFKLHGFFSGPKKLASQGLTVFTLPPFILVTL